MLRSVLASLWEWLEVEGPESIGADVPNTHLSESTCDSTWTTHCAYHHPQHIAGDRVPAGDPRRALSWHLTPDSACGEPRTNVTFATPRGSNTECRLLFPFCVACNFAELV
eukprot:3386658-Amphidinium_carterae.1